MELPENLRSLKDDADTYSRRFLTVFNTVVALASLLALLSTIWIAPVTPFAQWIPLAFVLVAVASQWALVRWGAKSSGIVLCSCFWVLAVINAIGNSGIHTPAMVLFPFVVAVAGWMLGDAWLVGFSLVSVTFMVGLGAAETLGWFVPTARPLALGATVTHAAVLSVIAFMTWGARSNLAVKRRMVQSALDASERQYARLVESREETDRLMRNMPAAVASFDAQSRLVRCNQRYADLFAAQPEAIVGKWISDYVPQVALDQLLTYWHAALAGTPQSYRRFNVDPQTQLVTWVDVALMPILDGGKVVGLDAVLMDVTDKVQAEAELLSLNMDLEQRVEKRTRALMEAREKLEESRDELLRSQGAVSLVAMVAGVAHELGTPIGNSRLAADSMQHLLQGLKAKWEAAALSKSDLVNSIASLEEGARIAQANLVRAESLLHSFRQVSADQASAQRRAFDLAETVNEVVLSMTPMLRRKPHRLVVDIPAGIGMFGQPGPVGQVLINLINNAFLHAFEGMAQGTLTVHAQRPDETSVVLAIEDDGCGMSPEVQQRLFDPFFSTRIGQGGTGLGMGIVKRIVEDMLGGAIEVDSVLGRGTRFVITLPLDASTASPAAAATP